MHDPSFFLVYNRPKTFPGLKLKLQNDSVSVLNLSLKKHVDLPTKNSPCNKDPAFNFAQCVIQSLSHKANCSLPWIMLGTGNLSACTEVAQLRKFSMLLIRVAYGELEEIVTLSGCDKPCVYNEYILDENEEWPGHGLSWVEIMFSSKQVLSSTEVESYSFLSFISDIGGSLGMFVGFSFLMVWDAAEIIIRAVREHLWSCN